MITCKVPPPPPGGYISKHSIPYDLGGKGRGPLPCSVGLLPNDGGGRGGEGRGGGPLPYSVGFITTLNDDGGRGPFPLPLA